MLGETNTPTQAERVALRGVGGLPLLAFSGAGYAGFYAADYLCLVAPDDADALEAWLSAPEQHPCRPHLAGYGATLLQRARAAEARWTCRPAQPFLPTGLTLALHRRCNLGCSYCYADAHPGRTGELPIAAVQTAAALIAANAAGAGLPLTCALHGGCEPTLDQRLADTALTAVEDAAAAADVPVFRYMATNGAIPEERARWLTRRIDLVGLSCDGPPEIQDTQRPRWGGGDSAPAVARTAHILREAGRPFHVRTTITRHCAGRVIELVDFICAQLRPEAIHIEPVYGGGRAHGLSLGPDTVRQFADQLLAARQVAAAYGIRLVYTGCRLPTLHGPYCEIFRNALCLVPGGGVTACFKATDGATARARGVAIGAYDPAGTLTIDTERIKDLQARLSAMPQACASCAIRLQCARACPEHCAVWEGDQGAAMTRCALHQILALADVGDLAERLAYTAGTLPAALDLAEAGGSYG